MSHHTHTPGEESPPISSQEFEALAEMIGADMPEILVDVLETYLEESAGLVETITVAAQNNDEQTMLRPVHSLKSSSASVGAMRLSAMCEAVESYLRGGGGAVDIQVEAARIAHEFSRVQTALASEKENLLNT